MKVSRYNHFVNWNNFYFGINLMTGKKIFLTNDQYHLLSGRNTWDDLTPDELETYRILEGAGFIVSDDTDEFGMLKIRHNQDVYVDDYQYQMTVMPTLNCNLNCWYCYETHLPSQMGADIIERVKKFAQHVLSAQKLKVFNLDWFGGEPLMYFEQVVYPLSKHIKALTSESGVAFTNSATTNGVLITEEQLPLLREIDMKHYQITIDGYKDLHDHARKSRNGKGSYDTIVRNIHGIHRVISDATVSVRINYTDKTFDGIYRMIDDLPKSRRISFAFQQVWQLEKEMPAATEQLDEIKEYINRRGNKYEDRYYSCGLGTRCYADKMNQIVVNYDGKLFKCTARDFTKDSYAVGHLDEDGNALFNAMFWKRFQRIPYDNPKCQACDLVPGCLGVCSQKILDNPAYIDTCDYDGQKKNLQDELYAGMYDYILRSVK